MPGVHFFKQFKFCSRLEFSLYFWLTHVYKFYIRYELIALTCGISFLLDINSSSLIDMLLSQIIHL